MHTRCKYLLTLKYENKRRKKKETDIQKSLNNGKIYQQEPIIIINISLSLSLSFFLSLLIISNLLISFYLHILDVNLWIESNKVTIISLSFLSFPLSHSFSLFLSLSLILILIIIYLILISTYTIIKLFFKN